MKITKVYKPVVKVVPPILLWQEDRDSFINYDLTMGRELHKIIFDDLEPNPVSYKKTFLQKLYQLYKSHF